MNNIKVDSSEISLSWENPQTHLPLTDSQVINTLVQAGFPLVEAYRAIGADEKDVQNLLDAIGNATLPA